MQSTTPTNVLLTQGTILGGKYRVEGAIAEGGMSIVLLGRDIAIDERVAIKLLKPEQRLQKDVLARFVREAKTIRRIQSERCVKVHDVGMDPFHGPFLVMELLEGHSLKAVLDAGGRFIPRRAVELAIQICEGLAGAHIVNCIHRDIKPDNVIVLQRGDVEDVRILDFGISKHALTGSILDQDISLINTISLMGSPAYMSPEQMRSTSNADARSDIWSLGAVLFEMLTGRPPFMSDSITELCSMVISDEPPLASAVEPAVPPALAEIVARCLRKNPLDRFQNVGDLAVALMEFAPNRARMSLDRTLAVLGATGVSVTAADDFNESTLILPSARASAPPMPAAHAPSNRAVAVTPLPPGSYPPFPSNGPNSSNIAFAGPPTPRRPQSAMPTVVSLAKVEERERKSKRWIVAVGVLAVAAFVMLFAGMDARARRRAAAVAAAARTTGTGEVAAASAAAAAAAPSASAVDTASVATQTATPAVSASPSASAASPVAVGSPADASVGAPSPASVTKRPPPAKSRVRVIDDDEPRRPRVLD